MKIPESPGRSRFRALAFVRTNSLGSQPASTHDPDIRSSRSKQSTERRAQSPAPAGTGSRPPATAAPALLPASSPVQPAFLPNLFLQPARSFLSRDEFFSPLREPRMMLRLCNVNRCGVYNYSCVSSGGACLLSTRAPLAMGCSRGGPQPWQSNRCMGGPAGNGPPGIATLPRRDCSG